MGKMQQKLREEAKEANLANLGPDQVPERGRLAYEDCTAYSMQCFKNGMHNNFRILTIKIEGGVVREIKYSDPYASFEFIDQLNVITDKACQSLNMHWKDGLCLD